MFSFFILFALIYINDLFLFKNHKLPSNRISLFLSLAAAPLVALKQQIIVHGILFNSKKQSNTLDIDFIDDNHGFLVGSNRLIMETTDGGKTWEERSLDLSSEENFRLLDIDFKGEEGWLLGQPSLVMHTYDGGKNWTRLSLGNKLPGQPFLITTIDIDKAELATTAGAIYSTSNSGESWEAKVIDASGSGGVRDLRRTNEGDYVSVSSLGNFFSTLESNSDTWVAHQRASSKRVQSIGFNPSGNLWMLSRGAEIRFNENSEKFRKLD